MQTRAFVRTLFVLGLSVVCLAITLPDIALPWHPFSTFGFSAQPVTGLVTTVDEDAASRGLHVGDRIDIARLSQNERHFVASLSLAPEGTVVAFPLTTREIVTLESHRRARGLVDNLTDVLAMLAFLSTIVIAAALLLLRPAPATWAFYIYCVSISTFRSTLVAQYAPWQLKSVIALFLLTLLTAGSAALICFALRFPAEQPAGGLRRFEQAVLFVAAPAILIFEIAGTALGSVPAVSIVFSVYAWSCAIAAAVIFLGRYVSSDLGQRSRLQWIVAIFAVAFIPRLLVSTADAGGVFAGSWVVNVSYIFQTIAPAGVAYTVLRHRLFDIRLIFSRTVLYALMTSIMVFLLAVVDWGVERWLAESRFALVLEGVLAVGVGVLLTTTHHKLERALNTVIFRSQALAMEALRRFARETDLISDPHYLLLQTYEALKLRLEADYVAIYTVDGSAYALVTPPSGAPIPSLLPGHDFAVLRLRRWHESFECEEPSHPLYGALLLPMTARGHLIGFIVCGPKRDRTHYLPDELATLLLLANAAGSAYALLNLAAANTPMMPATQ